MHKTIIDTRYQLHAFVFPYLGLVEQFVNDYINDTEYGFGILHMNNIYDVNSGTVVGFTWSNNGS